MIEWWDGIYNSAWFVIVAVFVGVVSFCLLRAVDRIVKMCGGYKGDPRK